MTDGPYAEYERRLAAFHERDCRHGAALSGLLFLCAVRKCRRNRRCSGAMAPAARQEARIRRQQSIGLSGAAVAKLPPCLAGADDSQYASFEAILEEFKNALRDRPDLDAPTVLKRHLKRVFPGTVLTRNGRRASCRDGPDEWRK